MAAYNVARLQHLQMELAYLVGATPADVRKGLFTLDDGRSTPYARLIDEVNPSGPRLLTGPPVSAVRPPCPSLRLFPWVPSTSRGLDPIESEVGVAEDWKPDDDVIERTDTAMRKWRQGHVFAEGTPRGSHYGMSPSPARQPKSEERARESRSSAMTTWSWSLRPATLSRLLGTRRRWPSVRSSESCSHSRRSIAGQRFERAHAEVRLSSWVGCKLFRRSQPVYDR